MQMAAMGEKNVSHEFDANLITSKCMKEFGVKWTMNDFSQFPVDIEFDSCLEVVPGIEWKLFLQKGKDRLYMSLQNMSKVCLNPEFHASIIDSEGKSWYDRKTTLNIDVASENTLLDMDEATYRDLHRLKDDICIVVCRFKIAEFFTRQVFVPKMKPGEGYDGRFKLCTDLKAIREDSQHIDIELNAKGGKVSANKAFLAARSPVFRSMFRDSHSQNAGFRDDDVDVAILSKLVDFIYVGQLRAETSMETAIALYVAADKYKILDLRKMLADTLLPMLMLDNFTKILMIADRHGDTYLMEGTMDFILENAVSIMGSDTWITFVISHTKLAAEVFKYCSKRIDFQPRIV